ncbi:hypothetical protein YYG_02652 [Plasmodium vinckei petteri]|uniref:Uncharacterized protein n=1 Tax=Plasmodium vinckei petteri TaxID=138298 RepID=W7B2D9_PLAVN|nr:hypothetical protein YYG_02652 [Plasmodium vinckei petteri]
MLHICGNSPYIRFITTSDREINNICIQIKLKINQTFVINLKTFFTYLIKFIEKTFIIMYKECAEIYPICG